MAAANKQEQSGSVGPVGQMLDDFHAYTDAIRTSHEDRPEQEANLLAKLTAAYPDTNWSKPAYLEDEEHGAQGDEQEPEQPVSECIHGREWRPCFAVYCYAMAC